MLNVYLVGAIGALGELGLIRRCVLFLEHAHLFNLIEVDDEALVHVVEVLDALAAENRRVLRTIEVLDALVVDLAQVGRNFGREVGVFFVCVQVSLQALFEVDVREERVLRHYLVQDVEVEGELVHALDTLEELPADRTADTPFAEEVTEAAGAKGVSATHNYTRDAISYIVFVAAEVTEVQLPVLVVCLKQAVAGRLATALLFCGFRA